MSLSTVLILISVLAGCSSLPAMFPMPPAVTPTVYVPQVSNGLIAFTAQPAGAPSDIYTMNPDGTDIKRLTTNGGYNPVWTNDGNIFFVEHDRDGNRHHSIMRPDSTKIGPLFEGYVESFIWSPDGTKVALNVLDETDGAGPEKFDIYILNADGTDAHRLPTYEADLAVAIEPAWSPDSNQIVFVANRGEYPDDQQDMYVIDVDGSNLRQITNNVDVERIPQWSSDGKRIFFASRTRDVYSYVMNADGTNVQVLIDMPIDPRVINYTWKAWPISPDGTLMLIPTHQDEKYFMSVVETDTYSIVFTLEDMVTALWSPDGRQILYHDYFYKQNANYSSYHIMYVDGTNNREFKSPFASVTSFAWQPVWK